MDLFDWHYYLKHNNDLINCGIVSREQAYYHLLSYGKKEGRKYHFFNNKTEYYMSNIQYLINKDIITKSDGWDIITKIIIDGDDAEYGNFDWQYYIKVNQNIFKHVVVNKKDAILHWNTIGKYDKDFKYIEDDFEVETITKDNFDWIYYIKNNIDLIKNDILNSNCAWEHWCNYGKYERREYKCKFDKNITYETFDWEYYLENNIDLIGKGFTQEGAWQHWIYYGRNEDRKIRLYNEEEMEILINQERLSVLLLENNTINETNELKLIPLENLCINNDDKKDIEDYLNDN